MTKTQQLAVELRHVKTHSFRHNNFSRAGIRRDSTPADPQSQRWSFVYPASQLPDVNGGAA